MMDDINKPQDLIENQPEFIKSANYLWIPWATLSVILLLVFGSFIDKGAVTWAFNAIQYMPFLYGITTLVFLVFLIIVGTLYKKQLEQWIPNHRTGTIIKTSFLVLGILIILFHSPLFPHMEGDTLPSQGRFGYSIASELSRLTGISFLVSVQIIWKCVGVIYLLFCFYFTGTLFDRYWDKLSSFLFMVSYPGIMNFIGYYDSYGDFFTFGSIFLGSCYLWYLKRKWIYLIAAAVFLGLSGWAHHSFYALLFYPLSMLILMWIKPGKLYHFINKRISILFLLGILIPGLIVGYKGSHNSVYQNIGYMFTRYYKVDGIVSPFYRPFELISSFLLSYIFLIAMMLIAGKTRFFTVRNKVLSVSLYASLGFVLSYYLVQLLMPIATYELLDFVCQSGCLGVLVVVPMMIFLSKTDWKQWIYCLVALNLFIVIPNMYIHNYGGVENRILASLKDERSISAWEMSPYVTVGLHFKEDNQKELAYVAFSLGVNDNKPPFRRFSDSNLNFLTAWQYEWGNFKPGKINMEKLLKRNPKSGELLLSPEAGLSNRKYYTFNTLIRVKDVYEVSEELYKTTGDPYYLKIAKNAKYLLYKYTAEVLKNKK